MGSQPAESTRNRSVARVETLLTFMPPGPPDLEKLNLTPFFGTIIFVKSWGEKGDEWRSATEGTYENGRPLEILERE